MFLISGPDLVIAASRAGVLGAFPAANCRTIADLDEWLDTITRGLRQDGDSLPWAMNVVTHRSNARLPEELRLVAEYQPPVVITALGSPRPALEVVKAYGGIVMADVINLALARKAVDAGADGLACVSAGAGGHTGHLSPFAFVSAVREHFDGLVAVGGGISDGHGVAGAIALGADLALMGTRFIATPESMADEAYRQMIVDHGTDALIVSPGITGVDASWLRPSIIANGLDPDALVAHGELDFRSGDVRRWKDIWAAGQGLETIRAVAPVARVVDDLTREYHDATDRLTGLRVSPPSERAFA